MSKVSALRDEVMELKGYVKEVMRIQLSSQRHIGQLQEQGVFLMSAIKDINENADENPS